MLSHADAIMEENPDSALTILRGIDRTDLIGRDRPYYALLMTQAQVKTDVSPDSDSLITIAYHEYANDWHGDKGIRSNFYMGEILFNQEKPRDAMKYYLTAYEESKRLGNHYWRAKSAERIADLFFDAYNYEEAAKYRIEAIEYFGKADRITNQRYAIADLATIYLNDRKSEESLSILDSLYNVIETEMENDPYLLDYIKIGKVNTLVSLKNFEELPDDYIGLINNPKFNPNKIDIDILKLRIPDESLDTFSVTKIIKDIKNEAITTEDKAHAYYAYYLLTKSEPNQPLNYTIVDSLILYQDALVQDIIRESITAAERDFYIYSSQQNHHRMRMTIIITVISIFIAIVIIIIFWRFHRLKDLTRKAQLEANVEALVSLKINSEKLTKEKESLQIEIKNRISELLRLKEEAENHILKSDKLENEILEYQNQIQILRKELEHETEQKIEIREQIDELTLLNKKNLEDIWKKHNTDNEKKDTVLKHLFRERWSTLSHLCEEYYERGSSMKLRESIQQKIETEVRNIGSQQGLQLIETETNKYCDGLVTRLRKECPNLKEKDIHFCCLLFAGFSVRAICFILDITTNYFYLRKKRLIERINSNDSPYKSIFLANIG